MNLLPQSTAVTLKMGPFVSATDGDTAQTGLSITQADVRLSKNGGDYAQKNDTGTATHDELGEYDVALNTTDTGTLGRLRVFIKKTGALAVWKDFMVIPQQVYNSLVGGTDTLEVDAILWRGTQPNTLQSGRVDGYVGAYATGLDPATQVLAAPANKLLTDATGNITLANGVIHGGAAAVLSLERIVVNCATANEPAVKLTGNGTAPGIRAEGGATGAGIYALGGGSGGRGAHFQGTGSQQGFYVQANTGIALHASGGTGATFQGSTSYGLNVASSAAGIAGLRATGGVNGHGASLEGNGTGSGIYSLGGGTGPGITCVGQTTAPGLLLTGGSSAPGLSANAGAASAASGIETYGGATGHGILAIGGLTSGDGIKAQAFTSGQGINALGAGAGAGLAATGGASGHGLSAQASGANTNAIYAASTAGRGVDVSGTGGARITSSAGHGLEIADNSATTNNSALRLSSNNGYGLNSEAYGYAARLVATGPAGQGLFITGNGTGSGLVIDGGASSLAALVIDGTGSASRAVSMTAGASAPETIRLVGPTSGVRAVYVDSWIEAAIHGTITGNLSGNVTGSVGSVTGAVGSVTGAVGSVTGNVGGNVVGSVASVTGSVGSVTNAVTVGAINAAAVADLFDTDSGTTYASAVAGSLVKEIADNAGGGTAPTAAEVADAVWDELLSGHTVNGSAGEALAAAGTAGDPWTTTLPGSYTGAQAGAIIGGMLNGVTLADGDHGGTSAVLTLERVVVASTTTDEPAVRLTGNGTGEGLDIIAGATGNGLKVTATGASNTAILVDGGRNGIYVDVSAAGGTGLYINSYSPGVYEAVNIQGLVKINSGAGLGSSTVQITNSSAGKSVKYFAGADLGTVNAERLIVASTTTDEPAVKLTGNGTGAGLHLSGGSNGSGLYATGGATAGSGIYATAQTQGDGIAAVGAGTGSGVSAQGGSTAPGMEVVSGASGIAGLYLQSTNGHGIYSTAGQDGARLQTTSAGSYAALRLDGLSGTGLHVNGNTNAIYALSGSGWGASIAGGAGGIYGWSNAPGGVGARFIGNATGNGLECRSGATSGHGIYANSQTEGDGIRAVGAGTGYDINADIQGNLSGSVGSVTNIVTANVTQWDGANVFGENNGMPVVDVYQLQGVGIGGTQVAENFNTFFANNEVQTTKVVDDVGGATGTVDANLVQIDGVALGTGDAGPTLRLRSLQIASDTTIPLSVSTGEGSGQPAVYIQSDLGVAAYIYSANASGLQIAGATYGAYISNNVGPGAAVYLESAGIDDPALWCVGDGGGPAVRLDGLTGNPTLWIQNQGGGYALLATSTGDCALFEASSTDGVAFQCYSSDGTALRLSGNGSGHYGLQVESGGIDIYNETGEPAVNIYSGSSGEGVRIISTLGTPVHLGFDGSQVWDTEARSPFAITMDAPSRHGFNLLMETAAPWLFGFRGPDPASIQVTYSGVSASNPLPDPGDYIDIRAYEATAWEDGSLDYRSEELVGRIDYQGNFVLNTGQWSGEGWPAYSGASCNMIRAEAFLAGGGPVPPGTLHIYYDNGSDAYEGDWHFPSEWRSYRYLRSDGGLARWNDRLLNVAAPIPAYRIPEVWRRANRKVTSITYHGDPANRQYDQITYDDGGVLTHNYDGSDNLISVTET